jgi:hypothetical protein
LSVGFLSNALLKFLTCRPFLQVALLRNFNKALLKKPTDNILDFYSLLQKVPHDNLLCCTRNETKEISQSSESVLEAIFDPSYEPQDIFRYSIQREALCLMNR